jgi:two-component system cell cycle response regulator DivK
VRKRILVVEDNPQNLYLVTFLLQKKGYEVIAAANGREGVEKACLEKPDLILMDVFLPVMDGYEALRKIKAESGMDRIPIVAITSFAMTGDREKAIGAGFTDYIEKPIVPETFVSQVEKNFSQTLES